MIKVINSRDGGSLFHYAHFICDCLFPEIICDIFKYDEVIREKNIHQTIGNFTPFHLSNGPISVVIFLFLHTLLCGRIVDE